MRLPDFGLIGHKRTGKDTVAGHLRSFHGYAPMAFADPLRAAADALNPIVGVDSSGKVTRYADVLRVYGYETAKEAFPEVRRVLQVIGTEVGREIIGQDVWVEAAMKAADLADDDVPLVFTDVRFPNEAEALAERGFVLVRLTRETGLASDPHPSETALDGCLVDYTVRNDGSLEDLTSALSEIVHRETQD